MSFENQRFIEYLGGVWQVDDNITGLRINTEEDKIIFMSKNCVLYVTTRVTYQCNLSINLVNFTRVLIKAVVLPLYPCINSSTLKP